MLPGTSTDVEDTGNIGQCPPARKWILAREFAERRNRLGRNVLSRFDGGPIRPRPRAQANQRRARAIRAIASITTVPAANPTAPPQAPAGAEPPLGSITWTRLSTPPYHKHM